MVLPGRAMPEPVGHAAERARLREFVDGQWPAEPLLLVGEAGSGKTVLLTEAVQRASERGATVLTTSAAAPETDMAYGSLVDLLGNVVDEVLDRLPELPREAVEVAFLRRRAESEPTQLAVGSGVSLILNALAERGPLLLAIDDLHWMDWPSTLAIGYGLRRVAANPVALIATARVSAPAIDPDVPALPFSTWAREVPILGFGPREFAELLRHNGSALSMDAAEQLRIATGGNPGWALEVTAPHRDYSSSGEPLPLPSAVAGTVGARLAGLSEPARKVLRMVAASGTSAPGQLRTVLRASLDDPQQAIDEATTELVIVEKAGHIEVAHPLLAAAALGELAPGKRRELHARLAGVAEDAEAKAYHLQRSAEPGPDKDTADALMAAAQQARKRGAAGPAARMAEQALARAPRAASDDGQLATMIDAAAMQFSVGKFNRVCELLSTVDMGALPVALLDRALALLIEASVHTQGIGVTAELVEELRAGMAAEPLRIAVLYGIGADLDFYPTDRTRAMATEAATVLRDAPVGELARYRAVRTLNELAQRAAEPPDETLVAEQKSLHEALEDDGISEETTAIRGTYSLWVPDDPDLASAALRRRLELARERGERYIAALCIVGLATTDIARGDYGSARALLHGLDRSAFGDSEPPLVFAAEGQLLIRAGDFGKLDNLLAAQNARRQGDPAYRELYVHALTGIAANRQLLWAQATEALSAAATMLPRLGRIGPSSGFGVDAELVEALLGSGKPEEARPIAERLCQIGERTGSATVRGIGLRSRGIYYAATGNLDLAEDQLAASVALFENSALRIEHARGLFELGKVRRRQRGRRAARENLLRAYRTFSKIGDVPLARLAEAELARLTPAREKQELTTAERRVAELVVTGATNREVAASLFVSVRTVESHMQSAYRKLGVHSRTQLAAQLNPGPTL